LVGNLAGHQEAKRFLNARVVSQVDEPFIDNLGTGFSGDVRSQVCGRLANRIDVRCRPRNAC
jgi:hypothetical protein